MLHDIRHFASSLMARVMVAKEDGQALVEYSLILGLISVVAIATLAIIGGDVLAVLETVATELGKAV
jgi:Flp pilus assembly pilin Flp